MSDPKMVTYIFAAAVAVVTVVVFAIYFAFLGISGKL